MSALGYWPMAICLFLAYKSYISNYNLFKYYTSKFNEMEKQINKKGTNYGPVVILKEFFFQKSKVVPLRIKKQIFLNMMILKKDLKNS